MSKLQEIKYPPEPKETYDTKGTQKFGLGEERFTGSSSKSKQLQVGGTAESRAKNVED